MVLGRLFRRDPWAAPAAAAYGRIVAQARLPVFYAEGGVPDTLDGRFELISLHAFLLFRRLKREGQAGTDLAQAVFDAMFADMDASLRELGAGDLGIPHRIKRMVSGFYGRVAAYEAELAAPVDGAADGLAEALRRNLYGTVAPDEAAPAALAGYMRMVAGDLDRRAAADLLAGRLDFPVPALSMAAANGGRGPDN